MLHDLKKYIGLVIEGKLREADITDGKTEWGSEEHIKDLEKRIDDLVLWRDKQRRGSEARANYARVITRLKSELASAKRHALRKVKRDKDVA